MDIQIGDVLVLKKVHPCGCANWRVLRAGADFRVECVKCNHVVWISRVKLEKNVRKVIRSEVQSDSPDGMLP